MTDVLPYKKLEKRMVHLEEKMWSFDEPNGEVLEAIVYVEMPVEDLKEKKVKNYYLKLTTLTSTLFTKRKFSSSTFPGDPRLGSVTVGHFKKNLGRL